MLAPMRRILMLMSLVVFSTPALARDQIRIVGSSTVFPFVSAAAEQFGREGKFRTPIVESTGTGGGFKMFCDGVDENTPDLANASRPIKPAEVEQCKEHGITKITEIPIGYDGIVIASSQQGPVYKFTKQQLFLALAREVPKGGKLVENPYTNWKQIDASLPDAEIEIYGPPPVEGTRDALAELLMEKGCAGFPEFAAMAEAPRKAACTSMREDGRFIELLGGNIMVQKLVNNPTALAIFGYNFLEQNTSSVKASPVDGIVPTPAAISSGKYSLSRGLFVYVKGEHLSEVPGIREFLTLLVSDAATGEDGYLIMRGLLPLPAAEHDSAKTKVEKL